MILKFLYSDIRNNYYLAVFYIQSMSKNGFNSLIAAYYSKIFQRDK